MRFGIFYEHQLPRPWTEDSERRLIADALEQVELADRVGFDYVWEVEHHFLEEYSHSSAADVFLAAASQRAPNIRLGFGILPLPPGYQHPARVAETVSMLDLVSGGRVEFGTGETSSGAELGGFGVDRESKRDQWDEALDVVTRMMVEEPFAGWDGRFFSMPPRNVVPKPVQRPHPPLWVACSRRETIRLAAEKGIGALSFSFIEPEDAREWVDEYYGIIGSERCVPGGFAVNPNLAVVLPAMVARDEAEAIERGIDGGHFFGFSLAHYYVFGDHRPGRTDIWADFEKRRGEMGFSREIIRADQEQLGVKILEEGFGSLRGAVGTPDQVRDLVERYERAGVDQLIFVMQAGKNRHEHIMESIELLGTEVIGEFRERAGELERDKTERLRGAVDAALARRGPARPEDTGHVIKPGDTGPPPPAPAAEGNGGGGFGAKLAERGEQLFGRFVSSSNDRRLERTVGSEPGLRMLFGGMAQRFRPDRAQGFTGAIVYELRSTDGTVKPWTVEIASGAARARPGRADDAAVVLKLGLADWVRIAGRDLDPGRALLTGRMEIEGDPLVAMRLGEMFGEPKAT